LLFDFIKEKKKHGAVYINRLQRSIKKITCEISCCYIYEGCIIELFSCGCLNQLM